MIDGIEIRSATTGDLDDIRRVEAAAFISPWRREFFEAELQLPGRVTLVAVDGTGEMAGYVFAMFIFDEMHINKIAVSASFRRRGIARSLMKRCLEFARGHDIHLISLEVRKSNDGAQAFYRRLEFTETFIRPRYYPDGEAAVVMSLVV
jgi:[ribosomal protein S18]-alanine N-acetyltransferase